ncbi:MAG: ROK family protein [Anaerolineae bacterium]|nr:ROK family protein [Anaerolineae bacterium]MCB9130918.1 ROK family protein [Anaerolineales bacterium]MCB0229640.1 ROK family protein [Anaerolineae bacterium]MCB0234528.1 ROK family protein [Anaerolineae bacterium]MCB0240808.1 ROK family protein [Anaerolineae bacterium]
MAKSSRRSRVRKQYRLGIDLGGTNVMALVVNEKDEIIGEAKKKTKAELGPQGVVDRIVATAESALSAAEVDVKAVIAAGVGAPGPVNLDTGVVVEAPNLPGWQEIPLAAMLSDKLGMPVFADNDVNLGTLGVHQMGVGRGTQHMVGIFVGTGVGGGLIINGQLHRGSRYSAGEIGHTVIVPNGPICGCGKRGCLEAVASRTAIEREVSAALAAGHPSVLTELLGPEGKNRLTSGVIRSALEAGDALMTSVMSQVQYYLGLLTANLVNVLDPEMVVFGGGVVEALGDDFLEPVRTTARIYYLQQRDADRVQIVPAKLGDYAGGLGGAALARQMTSRRRR